MTETFITAFRLKITYRVNGVIYSIKQLPIIGKKLPVSLYSCHPLKILGTVISILIELFNIFATKLLYVAAMLLAPLALVSAGQENALLHMFVFLTLAGGLTNTYVFNPSKDKYYAVVILKMDAYRFAVTDLCYSMLKVFIGFIPAALLAVSVLSLPMVFSVLMALFVVMLKLAVIGANMKKFVKTGVATNENMLSKSSWVMLAVLVVAAYLPPILGFAITTEIFLILCVPILLAGIAGILFISRFDRYKQLYKLLLTEESVYALSRSISSGTTKKTMESKLEYDKDLAINLTGFSFFHKIFVKRHRRLLTKAIKIQCFVIVTIMAALLALTLALPEARPALNAIVLTYLPYFVFIMYAINRGSVITQAMFMNCDHSMLTYRVYRTPRVILGIFTRRLRTLIGLNMIPAAIMGIGLSLLLYFTGGTGNILNYIVLPVSLMAMSVFFSVHFLVMYYLLQPYNINTKIKSVTYMIVQTMTYLICFFAMQLRLPTNPFGIAVTIFSLLYCIVSLVLAYRLAPRTFKIRY